MAPAAMSWKLPPRIKIYEALGSVADGRVTIVHGNKRGSVKSSGGNKEYIVIYDPAANAIMTNDNATYWQGYLGYPAIAFLMLIGVVDYDVEVAKALRGIAWKDVNTKFKYDFAKTEAYVLESAEKTGCDGEKIVKEVDRILNVIEKLNLEKLGKRILPPEGK